MSSNLIHVLVGVCIECLQIQRVICEQLFYEQKVVSSHNNRQFNCVFGTVT